MQNRQRSGYRRAGIALLTLSLCGAAGALPTFTDVALEVGLTAKTRATIATEDVEHMAGGATLGDFDRDGWQDIFFPRLDNTPILYRNVPHPTIPGQRSFVDVTPNSMKIAGAKMNGSAFGDVDNDGDLDLYVTTIHHDRFYMFMNNGSGGFTNEGAVRGVQQLTTTGASRGTSPAFGDYNRDGFLDLVTTQWGSTTRGTQLLKNRGTSQPGYYDNVTTAAGIVQSQAIWGSNQLMHVGFSPSFVDANRDGWPDLLVAADFRTSRVMWNDQDGTFTNGTTSSNVGSSQASSPMGSVFGDYDRDGDLDWFVTSIDDNRLYRNNGNSTFTAVETTAGVINAGWGWGTSFFDYDNDGWLDLGMTNGFFADSPDPTTLWRNNGDGTFAKVSPGNGINDSKQGRAFLTFDYDNDGDLDVFITNHGDVPILYRNQGGNLNNWLKVRTVGTLSNRDGIGALITVQPDLSSSAKMIWEVSGGSTYLGQSELNAFFGLGQRSVVDLITIKWPSGQTQTLTNVSANQFLTVTEVPEPAGLALLGLGAAGLLMRRRRGKA